MFGLFVIKDVERGTKTKKGTGTTGRYEGLQYPMQLDKKIANFKNEILGL